MKLSLNPSPGFFNKPIFILLFCSGLSLALSLKGAIVDASGQFEVSIDSTGFATIEDYLGSDTIVEIPNIVFIDGEGARQVRAIGTGAFRFASLEAVSVPASVVEIGMFAFADNPNLTTVTLFEGLETIGSRAFSFTGVESIEIPASVRSIEAFAFASTESLQEITVAQIDGRQGNFEADGSALFTANGRELIQYFGGLEAVNYAVPQGVEVIRRGAFQEAPNLQSVTFPDSLLEIQSSAFRRVKGIERVELPAGVEFIGTSAFADMDALREVVFRGTVQTVSERAFGKDDRGTLSISFQPIEMVVFMADAPGFGLFAEDPVFQGSDPTIYFYSDASGFSTPTWQGHPSVQVQVETVPGFGELRPVPLEDNVFFNDRFGQLDFGENPTNRTFAYSESLQSEFVAFSDALVASSEYGQVNPGADAGWLFSEFFGWTHFGRDFSQYGGWVNSERFDWMKFEEEGNGETYLWVQHLQTWLAVNQNGSFHSFDFGPMTPQAGSLTRYNTRIGMVTADPTNPQGWLASDDFGFVWFARDGTATWFWSEARQEWIGITDGGGLWSTAEGQFLD